MDAMQILVIILSVVLAIFLILAIVLTILIIKITQQIRSIATTAEKAVTHVSEFAATATRTASPAFLVDTIANFIRRTKSRR